MITYIEINWLILLERLAGVAGCLSDFLLEILFGTGEFKHIRSSLTSKLAESFLGTWGVLDKPGRRLTLLDFDNSCCIDELGLFQTSIMGDSDCVGIQGSNSDNRLTHVFSSLSAIVSNTIEKIQCWLYTIKTTFLCYIWNHVIIIAFW